MNSNRILDYSLFLSILVRHTPQYCTVHTTVSESTVQSVYYTLCQSILGLVKVVHQYHAQGILPVALRHEYYHQSMD